MTTKSLTTDVLKIRSVYLPFAFSSVITAIVVDGEVAVASVPKRSEKANPCTRVSSEKNGKIGLLRKPNATNPEMIITVWNTRIEMMAFLSLLS